MPGGITWIGDGGHAKVCREIASMLYMDKRCGPYTFIAIGDNRARRREAFAIAGPFVSLIHPAAIVSPKALIDEGTVIMAGAVIQAGAVIGRHVIINTGATVDHDATVQDYAHIAPGAHLCGGVVVEEGAHVGCGVAIAQNARIPAWTLCKARRLELCPMK